MKTNSIMWRTGQVSLLVTLVVGAVAAEPASLGAALVAAALAAVVTVWVVFDLLRLDRWAAGEVALSKEVGGRLVAGLRAEVWRLADELEVAEARATAAEELAAARMDQVARAESALRCERCRRRSLVEPLRSSAAVLRPGVPPRAPKNK